MEIYLHNVKEIKDYQGSVHFLGGQQKQEVAGQEVQWGQRLLELISFIFLLQQLKASGGRRGEASLQLQEICSSKCCCPGVTKRPHGPPGAWVRLAL